MLLVGWGFQGINLLMLSVLTLLKNLQKAMLTIITNNVETLPHQLLMVTFGDQDDFW